MNKQQKRSYVRIWVLSQESEESDKPVLIRNAHSELSSFQASLSTLTATHLTLIKYVGTNIRLSIPLACLIKQAGLKAVQSLICGKHQESNPWPLAWQVYTNQQLYHLRNFAAKVTGASKFHQSGKIQNPSPVGC